MTRALLLGIRCRCEDRSPGDLGLFPNLVVGLARHGIQVLETLSN